MSKTGSNNPMQKGKRRQKLHSDQDNIGNSKNRGEYKNFNGEVIE